MKGLDCFAEVSEVSLLKMFVNTGASRLHNFLVSASPGAAAPEGACEVRDWLKISRNQLTRKGARTS